MSEKPTDIFGIAPFGEATKVIVEKGTDGALGTIRTLFGPAAEEVGEFFRDKVRVYRYQNLQKMANKYNLKYTPDGQIHPKTGMHILEYASWSEEDEIAEMWAGLLASSCSTEGKDDSNLMFTFALQKLSVVQVRIIAHVCTNRTVRIGKNGLIYCRIHTVEHAEESFFKIEELMRISGCDDAQRLDRELDHLRSMELISDGFNASAEDLNANITPTALCLHFYARVNGHKSDPTLFYKKVIKD